MFRYYIVLLTLFGAFSKSASLSQIDSFGCFFHQMKDDLFPILNKIEEIYCTGPEKFERYLLDVAKSCTYKINKEDIKLAAYSTCNATLFDINYTNCMWKQLVSGNCKFHIDNSIKPFRVSCLRALWEHYSCLVDDMGKYCGKEDKLFVTYVLKAFHPVFKHLCL